MRPVNLLPQGERARRPSQVGGNASYVVLGVLGALLLATVGYVMTQNQINARTSEITRAEQEKADAEQRAARLGAFGEFAEIKETRVGSVTDLAKSRFDWERLMRELALVLPAGTWVTDLTASATPEAAADGATAPTAPGAAAPAGPSLSVVGCSKSQEKVAVVLVRLRKLHRANDVQLTESAESETAGAPGEAPAAALPAAGAGGQCAFFKFDATVTFDAALGTVPEAENRGVPAALGGGS